MIFGGGFLFFKFKKYQKLLILHDILLVVHKPLTCLDWQLNWRYIMHNEEKD